MALTHAPTQLLPFAVGPAGNGLVHVDAIVRQEVTEVRSRSSLQGDVRPPFLFDRYSDLFRWVLGPCKGPDIHTHGKDVFRCVHPKESCFHVGGFHGVTVRLQSR